jgi:hypothetical protein
MVKHHLANAEEMKEEHAHHKKKKANLSHKMKKVAQKAKVAQKKHHEK